MARKRWTELGDLNRCCFRSRRSYRLMRVLRPVVCSQAPIVHSREPDRAERCRIGSQQVGHNPARRKAVLLKQFHHAACASRLRWTRKSSTSLSLSTARQSQYLPPRIETTISSSAVMARSRPRTADIRRDRRPELHEPPPDRLVGCVNTSLGQQFLDIPKGQGEPAIEPDRVAGSGCA